MTILYVFITMLSLLLILLIRKFKNRLFTFVIMLVIIFGVTFATRFDQRNFNTEFESIKQRLTLPVSETSPFVKNTSNSIIIKIEDEVLIDAPAINQYPELPRGCEVTSLTMLLQYANVNANKMTLAQQIKKDPTPYKKVNGQVYFGNPNDGFVGSIYSFDEPGLGVYHKPIKELAETYLPGRIIDLTGEDFRELKIHLSDERPVWVIINSAYKKLSSEYFRTWQTPSGEIDITYKEHSVLITGFDKNFIYFNDPINGMKNSKAPIKDFEEAWIQMGSQAITYL